MFVLIFYGGQIEVICHDILAAKIFDNSIVNRAYKKRFTARAANIYLMEKEKN